MNTTIKDMLERRSIKKYNPEKTVSKDIIEKIIEAGLYAANGKGQQASIIIAVTNKEMRDKLSKANCKVGGWDESFDPFYGAPVVLVVLAKKSHMTYVYDGSLTMGNLMLAAHSLGVGNCWIHRAKEVFEMEEYKELLKSLGIEEEYEGIGHCVLGYPANEAAPKAAERKSGRVFYID